MTADRLRELRLLDRVVEPFVAANASGILVYVNPAAGQLLRWEPDALVGQPLISIMPPRMHEAHRRGFGRFVEGGKPRIMGKPIRVPALRSDNTEIEIELLLSTLELETGGVVFLGSMRARTELVELERQSELLALLETLLATAPIGLAFVDCELQYVRVNEALAALNGVPAEAHIGKSLAEVHPDFASTLEPVYRGVIETGLPSIGRELRREDPVVPGGAAHYLASHYPIRGARGEVLGVGVIVQDITERKRMEAERELLLERERRAHAAVQAERQRLYGLFMQAPAVIAVSRGPDHVFEMANPAFRALSGGVDPIGKSLREIRAELGRADGFVGFHDDIYASGQPFVAHEYPLTVPIDGTEGQQVRYYSFVIQPTRDAEGHVDGLLRHGVDVTEQVVARRRAEELATQLGNQQQWLEAVLNLLPVPLLFIEPATANVTFANVAAQEMAGGEIPRFVAANAEHTVHACTDDEGQRIADAEMPTVRVARGETLRDFTMNWHLPQGSKPLLLSGDTLPSMHGHAELAVLAFQDISRLKTIQAELTEAVRVRDEFMSVAGHELRTPLAALALQIQSLQRLTGQSERDDRIHARLGKAIRQVERLSELVTELLDVSRIASGTLELHVERFDLAALVVEVVARLEDSATQAGVRLVFNPVTEVFGEWDRSRIDQVTTNLLINAIKYGDKKPVVVVVEGKNDHGRITVRDEGIGIAHDAQERVFERFERAVSERHYGGLGVGLWLCREIVHAHGGRIALHSEPGVGTTVTADFPQRFSKEQV